MGLGRRIGSGRRGEGRMIDGFNVYMCLRVVGQIIVTSICYYLFQ